MSLAPSVAASSKGSPVISPQPLVYPVPSHEHVDTRREWLLTNGLGGFAMGTLSGVPTRRYHALLIAAMRPPVGRVALLNATIDTLHTVSKDRELRAEPLSSFQFQGLPDAVHPPGAKNISEFRRDDGVRWTYQLATARVTRSLSMPRARACSTDLGVNRLAIRWTIERTGSVEADRTLRLTIRPLVSLRDFHGLIRRHWADRFTVTPGPADCRVERDGIGLRLTAAASAPLLAGFTHDSYWWNDFFYAEDAARGQDCAEDLFSPGEFYLELPPGQPSAELTLTAALDSGATTAAPTRPDRSTEAAGRTTRLIEHVAAATPGASVDGWGERLAALVRASEDFVVARTPAPGETSQGASIIAGYPWFGDWGRDTLISLPGLLLTTGRFEEARAVLATFANHRRRGLIPNLFHEQSGEPEYNTVDASLWFIHAACEYLSATNDQAFWLATLAPACQDVIQHYRRGTDFNIAMDPLDKLITAGTNATQLTWMDARRDGVVFTPRHGKPVEINALWYNALRRVGKAVADRDGSQAANLNDLAEAAGRSFRAAFWHEGLGCCVDCLTPAEDGRSWRPVEEIRPNQIFAVSLPESPLTAAQQKSLVARVLEKLVTPSGVRTLDPADHRFRPRYEGSLFERDGAYHQGTAWPWLLGPAAEALMRSQSFSKASRAEALQLLRPLCASLVNSAAEPGACVGQIAEIYDGSAPQRPQGCPAQAWSIAEALRVAALALR